MTFPTFPEFFHDLTGFEPFPWQTRLAAQVSSPDGTDWPSQIALPTAAGKSSIVLIWAYALARYRNQPESGAHRPPTRLVYVVDRRIIVDAVDTQAQALAQWLTQPTTPAAQAMATALRSHESHSTPLQVARARGGLRPHLWVARPDQPAVLTATVDQVGSRLLFRGYGVSDNQRPIHAALLAIDTLIIVDEAHLSVPFVQTLAGIRDSQRQRSDATRIPPLTLVTMSATLPGTLLTSSAPFTLDADDLAHTNLATRLTQTKPIHLIPLPERKPRDTETFIRTVIKAVHQSHQNPAAHHIGAIVVNRVATARALFDRLRAEQTTHPAIREVALLTGRLRPIDRDRILHEYLPQIQAKTRSDAPEAPGMLWIVATQTIEVGADFDFDVMISENAPLDALRQRWGRLNRLGRHPHAEGFLIQHPSKSTQGQSLYGAHGYSQEILSNTWQWLESYAKSNDLPKRCIDASTDALDRALAAHPPEKSLTDPPIDAPILTWSHLSALSQTRPKLPKEPDIIPFLHGKQPASPDVQVIWRHDLSETLLEEAHTHPNIVGPAIRDLLTWVPPHAEETLELPLWIVQQWLTKHSDQYPLSPTLQKILPLLQDTETNASPENLPKFQSEPRVVWNYHLERSMYPQDLRPGDTILVPIEYGGVDRWGFNPANSDPATDLADDLDTTLHQHWRLTADTLGLTNNHPRWSQWTQLLNSEKATQATVDAFLDHLDLPQSSTPNAQRFHRYRAHHGAVTIVPYPDTPHLPQGLILTWQHSNPIHTPVPFYLDHDEQTNYLGDHPSETQTPMTLGAHHVRTERTIYESTTWLDLPDPIPTIVALAGRYHDLGKLEPRFQLLLHQGDAIAAAIAPEPLAKSLIDPRNRSAQDFAHTHAQYPRGMRHEDLSAQLLQIQAKDLLAPQLYPYIPLLLHLVGTHHGWGRPWFPVSEDSHPTAIDCPYDNRQWTLSQPTSLGRLDSGWCDQFAQLQAQWGFWGLAYLEMILRLADYQASIPEGGSRP